jgi:uncharacterized membrane protein YidH (DUF202 family)
MRNHESVSVNPIGLLVIAGGLFTAGCGIFDWQWAMTSRQGRLVSKMITRGGARAFYVVVGVGLIVVGTLMTIGVIEQT